MGEIGFALLILVVVGVPAWLCRGMGNRIKERAAPVPARSTKVVLSDLPASPQRSSFVPLIRTSEGASGHRAHLKNQASGWGMDPHAQDVHDAQTHGHGGHGMGDGHC